MRPLNETLYFVDDISSTATQLSEPIDDNSSLITGIMTLPSRSYISYEVPRYVTMLIKDRNRNILFDKLENGSL